MILGHLVPAGTGFKTHQESEVRLNAPMPRGEAAEQAEEGTDAEEMQQVGAEE